MKAYWLLILGIVGVLLSAGSVFAADPGGAAVSDLLDLGEMPTVSYSNVSVEAGNITQANLDTNVSTFRWAAVLGNVTGNIILGDDDNNHLYIWTALGYVVYASEAATPTWGGTEGATQVEVVTAYTHLATDADADSYNNTFTNSGILPTNILTITGGNYASTYDETGVEFWNTYSLYDGTNVIFAAEVDEDKESYKNTVVDYQMIVPEDGSNEDTDVTTYNLWVELI